MRHCPTASSSAFSNESTKSRCKRGVHRSGLPLLIKVLSFMAIAASIAVEERSVQVRMASLSPFGHNAFELLTLALPLAVVVLINLIGWQRRLGPSVAIHK